MDVLQLTASNVPITKGVEYSCVLTNNWSGANHPIDYARVSGSAHWSPPVLLAHSNLIDLWSPGDFASPGIENLAEMGTTSTLQSEIEVLQTKGLAGDLVIGVNQFNQFNAMNPTQDFETISLSPSSPCLSTISMMAPSPDWFSGIESFCPREPGGFWFQSFEVATYPFDAGTEMGETYSINNDPESRHGPIYPLTKETVPDSGILLDPTGTKVNPVAVWKCDLNDFEEMDKSPEEEFGVVKEDEMMKEIGINDLKNMDKYPEEEFGVVKEDEMMKEIGMNDLKNMDKYPEEEFGVVKEDGMMKEIGKTKKMKKEDPNGGRRVLRGHGN